MISTTTSLDDTQKQKDGLRHLIGVNCHPFHDPSRIVPSLQSLKKAFTEFGPKIKGHVQICIFWHGKPPSPEIGTVFAASGFDLVIRPHKSNGLNINTQLEYAQSLGFDTFFRVDGDDTVTADRFIAQAALFEDTPTDLVGTGLIYKTPFGSVFNTMPPQDPDARAYLENRFMLHPTLAMRLRAIEKAELRYWPNRLEDKAFILAARKSGLRIVNLPILGGEYNVGAKARRGVALKFLGFRLNIAFLRHESAFHLFPYAFILLFAQIFLGSQKLRYIRHLMTLSKFEFNSNTFFAKRCNQFKSILSFPRN